MEMMKSWWREMPAKWRDRATNMAMFTVAFLATVVVVEVLA